MTSTMNLATTASTVMFYDITLGRPAYLKVHVSGEEFADYAAKLVDIPHDFGNGDGAVTISEDWSFDFFEGFSLDEMLAFFDNDEEPKSRAFVGDRNGGWDSL